VAVNERQRGFTLVEVIVATALLLLTAACATPLLAGSQASGSRTGRCEQAGRLADATLEWLRSLPFAPPTSAGDSADPSDASLVGAVFPHADPARNTADDFVVLVDGAVPAGTFVTHRLIGGFEITTRSQFGSAARDGLAPLSPAFVAGFDSSTGGASPAGILFVTVVVCWNERGRELGVEREATLQNESFVEAGDRAMVVGP
jgi:prepilin-type N-terminal cleavage/methylation domain-containing protein